MNRACVTVLADVVQQHQKVKRHFWACLSTVSLERSYLSLAKSVSWLAVVVIYSKKPKSFMC